MQTHKMQQKTPDQIIHISALSTIVGASNVLTEDLQSYELDWRKKFEGRALAVAKPKTTEEVAKLVQYCATHSISIVPQGGNTGLVGGGTPDLSGEQLIINCSRMNQVLDVDLINNTMTVQAGCVLQSIQELAASNNRLFPLALAAQGSCEIGGNISTNAGGVQVLRYGNTRDLVLGLEVVLPDGQILPLLTGLRKDNTGYDLKQLFIGAEGTLGIITAAVLKLFPKPSAKVTAWIGLSSVPAAMQLLTLVKSSHSESLTAFELISRRAHEIVLRHIDGAREPLNETHPWYVLIEVNDSQKQDRLQESLSEALMQALENETIQDVVISQSEQESRNLWALRENITEAQVHDGKNIKHDVSLPISQIAQFIESADAQLEKAYPGVRPVNFGHLGDGNLHYNICPPLQGFTEAQWMAQWEKVNTIVHQQVARFNGSISAEHGVGQLKRDELVNYKSAVALNTMITIKKALDPSGIMNPRKVINSA
jgi:FAD/FMN-containing dehydrogenase